jgi:hypothetical protein
VSVTRGSPAASARIGIRMGASGASASASRSAPGNRLAVCMSAPMPSKQNRDRQMRRQRRLPAPSSRLPVRRIGIERHQPRLLPRPRNSRFAHQPGVRPLAVFGHPAFVVQDHRPGPVEVTPTACRRPDPASCRPAPKARRSSRRRKSRHFRLAIWSATASIRILAVGIFDELHSVSPASAARRGASASAHPPAPLDPGS